MRRRSSSFVGIRRHRMLILALPLLLILSFVFRIDLYSVLDFDLFPSLEHHTTSYHRAHDRYSPHDAGSYRIDKVSMQFDPNDLYDRAFDTQRRHNARHGYGLRI